MTLARELPHRKIWRCDNCGKEDCWQNGWMAFCSIADQEYFGLDVPTVCSNKCASEFQQKIDTNSVKIPHVKPHGYGYRVVGKRKGY